MSLNPFILVYGLWAIYLVFAVIYVISYFVWTGKATGWHSKIEGDVVRTAKRVSTTVNRVAGFMNFLFYATLVTFGVAIMVNIIAVENTYLYYVLTAIAAPWVLVWLCRGILSRQAGKRELRYNALFPRRLSILATARKETYKIAGK